LTRLGDLGWLKFNLRLKGCLDMIVGTGRASPRLFVVSGEPQRLHDQPKVRTSDEGALRMGDEGCPNESLGVDDATEYSKEQQQKLLQ
jgi:hypothetical protein